MNPSILVFDDLREISRLGPNARLATVARWASLNHIRYGYDAKGGIWTTVDAMNAAVGITSNGHAEPALLASDIVFGP